MLRRHVPARSTTLSDFPVNVASAPAISAPTRNRTAAISAHGRCRLPSRVQTFMPAKQACARTIQPRPRFVRAGDMGILGPVTPSGLDLRGRAVVVIACAGWRESLAELGRALLELGRAKVTGLPEVAG